MSPLIYILNKKNPFTSESCNQTQNTQNRIYVTAEIHRIYSTAKFCVKQFTSLYRLKLREKLRRSRKIGAALNIPFCLINKKKYIPMSSILLEHIFSYLVSFNFLEVLWEVWNLIKTNLFCKRYWIIRFVKIALDHVLFNEQENVLAFLFSLIYNWDAQRDFVQIKTF